MSEETPSTGSILLGWWSANIGKRDASGNRALSARLRRAAAVEVLSQRSVVELATALGINGGTRLSRFIPMVRLLAELRAHDGAPLARRIGGSNPMLSELRFQRLLRAEGDEMEDLMRRAIVVADRRCNVAALAEDLLFWGDSVRQCWCFQYFGAESPNQLSRESQE